MRLNAELQHAIRYVIRMEPGVQEPDETLALRSGSCRDSAWLLVQILRRVGLAARFVSGYLIQLKADVDPLEGPKGTQKDFTDLHAWAEVYLPGAGWIGMDATSGLFCGEGHLPLCATPHYRSAAPISGAVDPAEVRFGFEMKVTRLREAPRVTLPFTDDSWSKLDALGQKVDADLVANDVRLTMGGEPTFVSIDDLDAPEWNTGAVGGQKEPRAEDLVNRLHKRFGPGGFLHFGQGKWYPGESLPRWAYSLYWRKDGEPMWSDPSLIATGERRKGTEEEAQEVAVELAARLGLSSDFVHPAYEDVNYWLVREGELPVNVDPLEPKLDDPEERSRLRAGVRARSGAADRLCASDPALERGGDEARLAQRALAAAARQALSGAGRLAAGAAAADEEPALGAAERLSADPSARPRDRPAAAAAGRAFPRAARARGRGRAGKPHATQSEQFRSDDAVRTAMTVEVRDGFLSVFMPPTETLEDYLELLGTVEAIARDRNTPVRIEGYTPPPDSRLNVIKVTPDPGVIEVNVHPANSWREAVDNTTALYEEARLARLGTDKYLQ